MSAKSSEAATIVRATVEDFYYDEADMLDQFRLRDWLDLLTDDVRYRIPIRVNRAVPGRPLNEEVSDSDMLLDEDKRGLTQRVVRLETGRAWAEEPRSRTRHLIANVRLRAARGNEFTVTSNFIAYRNRLEVEQDFFVGTREDVLCLGAGRLKIASRLVLLDQAVLTAKNMTILF